MHKFLFSFLFLVSIYTSRAQQKAEQFNIPVNYLVYLPEDYSKDTAKQWPLMVFLHGSGESGTDIQKVKANGPPKLIEEGKQYPFIVISPQAPEGEGWEPQVIIRLIRNIQQKYKVDKERIYLTGLSMGGFGTWSIAMKFPTVFAAIAPICGGGDTADIMKLKHMPVWCFHGAKDDVVKPEESYRMINALKKFNPDVRLTIYPDANHNSWTPAYNNDTLYTWLLQQKRFHFPKVELTESKLNEFAGAYTQKGKDTLHLLVKDKKLIVKEQPTIELIPSSNNSFFIVMNDSEIEIKFKRNVRRQIEKLLVMDDKIVEFDKVK
jgi:predicted esterase